MQPVACFALEVAAAHAVIGLEVPNDRLDGLAPFEQRSVLLADPLGLASVHDVHIRVLCIHTPVAQINKRRRRLGRAVLHQDRSLLQLLVEGVAVVWVAVECSGAHDQVAAQRAGNTYLHTDKYGGLALPLLMQSTSGA